ncbi:MAG: tyrosine--tRNA ligase [Clostridia bacterium]
MFDVKETVKFLLKGAVEGFDKKVVIEKVEEVAKEGRVLNIKFGLDPSAPDIHLGHAVALRKIRQLQNLGHQAIIIIGDFTGMIGDPSGKSKTRNQLSKEQVKINAKTYMDQIFKIIDPDKTQLRFNSEWYDVIAFKDVINLCSKSTVARMLERDDFANRFQKQLPIAIHEFFYPLMQAYDSVVVKADIELGGTDQTFNILLGRSIQKDYGVKEQVPLFVPLLEGIDGIEKMSKSLGNYIGIKEDPYSMFEKTMKIPDSLIVKYYELATDVHPDTIEKIKRELLLGEKNPRDIKMDLAKEITAIYHSEEEAILAEKKFVDIFQKKVAPTDVLTVSFSKDDLDENGEINLVDMLDKAGNFKSKSEIRRLIAFGAVKVDGEKHVELTLKLEKEAIVQVGKGMVFKLERI